MFASFFQSGETQLQNQLFQLKFTSKQLSRSSKKCEKSEKAQKSKLKKAIEQGNMEGARIYAQSAIREKNQALNFLRLSSRIDAVASRVEGALRMGQLTKSMGGVVKGMDVTLKTMDVEKISKCMDKFEKQFEDLDVRSAYMEGAMGSSVANTTPQEDVDSLIQMTADEHSLDLAGNFDDLQIPTTTAPEPEAAPAKQEDDLAARLAALKS
jgi:charged multivesicular body protein 1